MKQVVITGAGGFIGRALTAALLRRNVAVCAIVSDTENLHEFFCDPNFSAIAADYSAYPTLKLPENSNVCYHLAWRGVSTGDYHNPHVQLKNSDAACYMAESVAKSGCKKMVFVGSTHQCQMGLQDGQITGKKLTAYGSAKAFAAEMCRMIAQQNGFAFSTALFPNVFGPGDYSKRSTNTILLQLMEQTVPKLIPGVIAYDCVYIDDAVRGLIAVAEQGDDGGVYYLGNRITGTFQQAVEAMRDAVAPKLALRFGEVSTSVVTDYAQLDLDRAFLDLGYEPKCDLKLSMGKTAAWLRENHSRF